MKDDRNKNGIGIKPTMIIFFSSFVLIMLILLWLSQVVFLNNIYETVKKHQILSTADKISDAIKDANGNANMLFSTVYNASREENMCVIVLDEKRSISVSAEAGPFCIIHKLSTASLLEYAEEAKRLGGTFTEVYGNNLGQVQSFQYKTNKENEINLIVVKEVVLEYGSEYLFLNASLVPVDSTVSLIRIQLLIITGIMLIFGIILALLISNRISRPVIKINNSAKKLSRGDFTADFDASGYREIKQLSQTLTIASKELAKTDKLQKELIANISHDLRTPLTMITGYGEMMMDIPDENTPENMQVIVDEAKRLSGLVSDLLDISKLQSGNARLSVTKFNITQSVRTILERYNKMNELNGYSFIFNFDRDVLITGDELKLSQVIYNLVNNAINYTGQDKKITVNQTVKSDCVRFDIIDSGNGISKDEIAYIWDRYYKVDKSKSHTRAHIGTGLGLSIVKKVLEMHNARLGVISNPEHGSDFWFELPLMHKD